MKAATIEGQPFSEVNLAQDRDLILNYYFNHGFPNVQMKASYEPDTVDVNRVDVSYEIAEGTRVVVDQVLVSGLNTRGHSSSTATFRLDRPTH